MPEKTAEDFVLHADGKVWFHTGDVGLMCDHPPPAKHTAPLPPRSEASCAIRGVWAACVCV